jgi:hypothetical protein
MVGLVPGLGSVSGSPDPSGTRSGCVCLGNVSLARFAGFVSWGEDLDSGSRFWNDVSHFLGGSHHGCCSRVMVRGLEIRVLDGVNTWSLAGSGCDLEGSTAQDSWMGTVYGIYPWGSSLVMGNLIGRRFGWVVDGFLLGGIGGGEEELQVNLFHHFSPNLSKSVHDSPDQTDDRIFRKFVSLFRTSHGKVSRRR